MSDNRKPGHDPGSKETASDDPQPARRDTFAWLIAAVQVVGPILAVIVAVALAIYGLLALLF